MAAAINTLLIPPSVDSSSLQKHGPVLQAMEELLKHVQQGEDNRIGHIEEECTPETELWWIHKIIREGRPKGKPIMGCLEQCVEVADQAFCDARPAGAWTVKRCKRGSRIYGRAFGECAAKQCEEKAERDMGATMAELLEKEAIRSCERKDLQLALDELTMKKGDRKFMMTEFEKSQYPGGKGAAAILGARAVTGDEVRTGMGTEDAPTVGDATLQDAGIADLGPGPVIVNTEGGDNAAGDAGVPPLSQHGAGDEDRVKVSYVKLDVAALKKAAAIDSAAKQKANPIGSLGGGCAACTERRSIQEDDEAAKPESEPPKNMHAMANLGGGCAACTERRFVKGDEVASHVHGGGF